MDYFNYSNGKLHAEDVALDAIASEIGTPFYVYSRATLERHYTVFADAVAPAQVCYAVKANSNIAVLKVLALLGCGADVVSGGEIRRALEAGIAPENIVFSGVGKTPEEMGFALAHGIKQFNVESAEELALLNDVAGEHGHTAPIALRVNPDIDAGTHAKITTGKKENKFGIPLEDAMAVYQQAGELPHIQVQGVSMHIGSQLTTLAPFRAAFETAKAFVQQLRAAGHAISVLDIGGGLGVPYEKAGESPPTPTQYGEVVREVLGDLDCELICEPGRLISGNAGLLVAETIFVKHSAGKRFLILDAAMNDLMRPALYDAQHELVPLRDDHSTTSAPYDVVGPVCETGDVFSKDTQLPDDLQRGDRLAFRTAGAYGATMSHTYNSRPLIAEVLVDGDRFGVIRPRQSYEELLALDDVPQWL